MEMNLTTEAGSYKTWKKLLEIKPNNKNQSIIKTELSEKNAK